MSLYLLVLCLFLHCNPVCLYRCGGLKLAALKLDLLHIDAHKCTYPALVNHLGIPFLLCHYADDKPSCSCGLRQCFPDSGASAATAAASARRRVQFSTALE